LNVFALQTLTLRPTRNLLGGICQVTDARKRNGKWTKATIGSTSGASHKLLRRYLIIERVEILFSFCAAELDDDLYLKVVSLVFHAAHSRGLSRMAQAISDAAPTRCTR